MWPEPQEGQSPTRIHSPSKKNIHSPSKKNNLQQNVECLTKIQSSINDADSKKDSIRIKQNQFFEAGMNFVVTTSLIPCLKMDPTVLSLLKQKVTFIFELYSSCIQHM